MTITDPSARMQVLGLGELMHPGTCMVCGNGNCEFGYVKLGVYFDYEGEMYLCLTCVSQAAEAFGMLSIEQAEFLTATSKELAESNTALSSKLEAANEQLQHYRAVLKRDLDSDTDIPVSTSPSVDNDAKSSNPEPDEKLNDESTGTKDSGEPVSTEPVKVERPTVTARPERSNAIDL